METGEKFLKLIETEAGKKAAAKKIARLVAQDAVTHINTPLFELIEKRLDDLGVWDVVEDEPSQYYSDMWEGEEDPNQSIYWMVYRVLSLLSDTF